MKNKYKKINYLKKTQTSIIKFRIKKQKIRNKKLKKLKKMKQKKMKK